MPKSHREEPYLLVKRHPYPFRSRYQRGKRAGGVVELHLDCLAFFLAAALFFSSRSIEAIMSSAFSNGPKVRPLLISLSAFARLALITRRCDGVYSASAFWNAARSIITLGVR